MTLFWEKCYHELHISKTFCVNFGESRARDKSGGRRKWQLVMRIATPKQRTHTHTQAAFGGREKSQPRSFFLLLSLASCSEGGWRRRRRGQEKSNRSLERDLPSSLPAGRGGFIYSILHRKLKLEIRHRCAHQTGDHSGKRIHSKIFYFARKTFVETCTIIRCFLIT